MAVPGAKTDQVGPLKPLPGDQVVDATSKEPIVLKLPVPLRPNEVLKFTKQPESGTVIVDPITQAVTFTPSPTASKNGIDTYEIVSFEVCDTTTAVCEQKSMRIRVLHANVTADSDTQVRSLAFTGADSLLLLVLGFLSIFCGAVLLLARFRKVPRSRND